MITDEKKKRRGTFLGESMRQTKFCLPLLEEVLTYTDFKRIIELGTGKGVLSYYFKLFCEIRNADFFTYDITTRIDMPFYEDIYLNYFNGNIFQILILQKELLLNIPEKQELLYFLLMLEMRIRNARFLHHTLKKMIL